MRILFSATAGDGHFYPLLPLAEAMRARGHDVAFAMSEEYAERIESAGFSAFPAGVDTAELTSRLTGHLPNLPAPTSPDYMPFVIAYRYAVGDAPDRLADLLALASTWRPEQIVFESCDLAAPIVAAALDIGGVHHGFGRALAAQCYRRSAPFLEPLWDQVGVTMPPLCGMYEGPYVDICPPSLQGDEVPASADVMPLRSTSVVDGTPPEWLSRLPDRASVYVTLGTIFNDLARLRLLLDAFADMDLNVLMTIGRDRDPADLGAIPPNAVVERFVPQGLVLPHVDAMVTHAGSGSMLAALAHGVPMVMLPRGADQSENARACVALGAARLVAPAELSTESVSSALSGLLSEPAHRRSAADLQREISAMPDARAVAEQVLSGR